MLRFARRSRCPLAGRSTPVGEIFYRQTRQWRSSKRIPVSLYPRFFDAQAVYSKRKYLQIASIRLIKIIPHLGH